MYNVYKLSIKRSAYRSAYLSRLGPPLCQMFAQHSRGPESPFTKVSDSFKVTFLLPLCFGGRFYSVAGKSEFIISWTINKHYADNRKHNVILSQGIFYFLSVCGLCSNLVTMEVSCPMKNGRVSKLSTKGWLSRSPGPFLLLPSSQEKLFCFLAFRRIFSFSLHLPGHRPADCQHILCSILL